MYYNENLDLTKLMNTIIVENNKRTFRGVLLVGGGLLTLYFFKKKMDKRVQALEEQLEELKAKRGD